MPDRIGLKPAQQFGTPTTKSRSMRTGIFILGILLATQLAASADDLPKEATLLDGDLVWDLEPPSSSTTDIQDPVFAISPDDQEITYISQGAIWASRVTAGPARKLVKLPGTKTDLLAEPYARENWISTLKARNSFQRTAYQSNFRVEASVHSLCWAPDQNGIVYTFAKSSHENPYTVAYRVTRVFNEGAVQPLSSFQRDTYDEPHRLYGFYMTRDMKHVVATDGYTSLIIVARTGKPRATCFDTLAPSPTSGRFIGIEIDTRQLVTTDEDFQIIKRFDTSFAPRRKIDLSWSPDERHVICREHLPHPSSNTVGFRLDLQNGQKRDLNETRKEEICTFTGRGGEIVRIGGFPNIFGDTYITLVPEGDEPEHDVVRWPNVQKLDDPQSNGRYPAIRMSRDAQLFAMAFPREGRAPGYRYFLVDRQGVKWPCGPDDPTKRISPYHVVAIANEGKTLVACSETELFSVPVDVIQNASQSLAPQP